MATLDMNSDPGTFQPTWTLAASEAGEAVRVAPYSDKSYAMWGTFGGAVILEGSWDKSSTPDPDSWVQLSDADATNAVISATARACNVILENPIWIRPRSAAAVVAVKVCLNCTKGG